MALVMVIVIVMLCSPFAVQGAAQDDELAEDLDDHIVEIGMLKCWSLEGNTNLIKPVQNVDLWTESVKRTTFTVEVLKKRKCYAQSTKKHNIFIGNMWICT